MLALLLSLSNPETGWQGEMALEVTAVVQTRYHLPSMRTTSSSSSDQSAQSKLQISSEASENSYGFQDQSYFVEE